MRTVELTKGIRSSALGFGCAPILGAVDANKSRRALDCALDCGITHFDLARSYGYGEAEQFVGNVMRGKRDQIVLASKFGIQADWKATLLKPVKPLVRLLRETLKKNNSPKEPVNKSSVDINVADRFLKRIPITGAQMQSSLEQSLRALKTDYLDYFFIHEPLESLIHLDELAMTAELLKKEGKIRAWGLAYMKHQEPLHQSYLNKFDILQFDNSPGVVGYDKLVTERGYQPNVIFSPFRKGSTDMKPPEKLKKLVKDFPNSVVLCSMFNEKHLRENASLID